MSKDTGSRPVVGSATALQDDREYRFSEGLTDLTADEDDTLHPAAPKIRPTFSSEKNSRGDVTPANTRAKPSIAS